MLQTTMGAIGMITDKMIEVAKAMVTSAKENEGKTWTESVLDLVVFGPVKVIGWIWGSEEPDEEQGKMLIDERDGDILMRGRPPGCPSSLKEAKKQMENLTDLEKRMIGFENVPMPPLQVNEEEEKWKETSDPVGTIFKNESIFYDANEEEE